MPDEAPRVPAGWYPDPVGAPELRWWDGRSWTEHTTEPGTPVPVPLPDHSTAVTPLGTLRRPGSLPFALDGTLPAGESLNVRIRIATHDQRIA